MNLVANLSQTDDHVREKSQIPRLIATAVRTLHDDTGESGETYDAEARSEAWVKAQTAH